MFDLNNCHPPPPIITEGEMRSSMAFLLMVSVAATYLHSQPHTSDFVLMYLF